MPKNMLNFSLSSDGQGDFFALMYSNSSWNIVTMATLIIGALVGLVSTLGIIWYERNGDHRYRTVINQMFSTLSWIVFWYIVLVYIPDGARFLIGPLHYSICEWIYLLKNFFIGCFLLSLDCIILLRYIFIFKWNKFAVINDDLMARFFNISIVVLSLWMVVVQRLASRRMPLLYFMCAGKSPLEDVSSKDNFLPNTEKINFIEILVYASFALHLIILTKIYLYERRMEKAAEKIQLGTLDISDQNNVQRKRIAWSAPKTPRAPNMTKSMIDFTTQMSCLLFLVMVASVNITVKENTEPNQVNQYKYRWFAYFHQIGITVGILLISLIYYVKNRIIFNTILKGIKSLFIK